MDRDELVKRMTEVLNDLCDFKEAIQEKGFGGASELRCLTEAQRLIARVRQDVQQVSLDALPG